MYDDVEDLTRVWKLLGNWQKIIDVVWCPSHSVCGGRKVITVLLIEELQVVTLFFIGFKRNKLGIQPVFRAGKGGNFDQYQRILWLKKKSCCLNVL